MSRLTGPRRAPARTSRRGIVPKDMRDKTARAVAPVVLHDHALSNGLRVLLAPRQGLHTAVVQLFVRAGARFEPAKLAGVSHFLEHMLFRGTRRHPTAHALAGAFERLGTTLDAATAVDHGTLAVSVPPENLEAIVPLLAECVLAPRFADIEVERKLVRQEILQELDEHGEPLDLEERMRVLLYGEHPLAQPIAGTLASLRRLDVAALRAQHRRLYAGRNMLVCVAGRIGDPQRLVTLLEQSFGRLPGGRRAPLGAPPAPLDGPIVRVLEHADSQTDLRLAFRAPARTSPMEPALEMMLRVLDDGLSTRLYERLCDRRGLCYDVAATYDAFEDDGVLAVEASTDHAQSPVVLGEILAVLDEIRRGRVTEAELAKARVRHRFALSAMRDAPEHVCEYLGPQALMGVLRTPRARHAELARITAGDIAAVATIVLHRTGLGLIASGLLSATAQRRLRALCDRF